MKVKKSLNDNSVTEMIHGSKRQNFRLNNSQKIPAARSIKRVMEKTMPDKKVYLAELKQQTEQAEQELKQALSQMDASLRLTTYAEWIHTILKYRQEYQVLNGNWPKDDIVSILKRAETIASSDIWGTAQLLPEPPKLDWSPNSKPHSELNKFYRWSLMAGQQCGKVGDEIKTTPQAERNAARWRRIQTWFKGLIKAIFHIFTKSFWEVLFEKFGS